MSFSFSGNVLITELAFTILYKLTAVNNPSHSHVNFLFKETSLAYRTYPVSGGKMDGRGMDLRQENKLSKQTPEMTKICMSPTVKLHYSSFRTTLCTYLHSRTFFPLHSVSQTDIHHESTAFLDQPQTCFSSPLSASEPGIDIQKHLLNVK